MSARDELATVISTKLDSIFGSRDFGPATQDYTLADAILSAGYTKPRTITTPVELDGLADGAVLMSGDRILMYSGAIWRVSGGMIVRGGKATEEAVPYRYFVDPLPATVLYEPAP